MAERRSAQTPSVVDATVRAPVLWVSRVIFSGSQPLTFLITQFLWLKGSWEAAVRPSAGLWSHPKLCWVGRIASELILKMNNLKLGDVKCLTQGNMAGSVRTG